MDEWNHLEDSEYTTIRKIYRKIKSSKTRMFFYGSRVTARSQVNENTDYDVLFYVPVSRMLGVLKYLTDKEDFVISLGEDSPYQCDVVSTRKDKMNIVVTSCKRSFLNYMKATELCEYLPDLDKNMRVDVYDYLVRGTEFPLSVGNING